MGTEKTLNQSVHELILKGAEAIVLKGNWEHNAIDCLVDSINEKFPYNEALIILAPPDGDLSVLNEDYMNQAGWFKKPPPPEPYVKEEVLAGNRYRRKYRGESIYILVAEDKKTNMPIEVFVRFDREGHDPSKYLTEAGWDAFTRMLSGWLQHPEVFPYCKTVRQVKKSSRIHNDLPGLIADILMLYVPEGQCIWNGEGE